MVTVNRVDENNVYVYQNGWPAMVGPGCPCDAAYGCGNTVTFDCSSSTHCIYTYTLDEDGRVIAQSAVGSTRN